MTLTYKGFLCLDAPSVGDDIREFKSGESFFRLTDDVALLGMISVAHKRRRAEAACSIHAPWNISFVWRTSLEKIGWGLVIVCAYIPPICPDCKQFANGSTLSPNLTLNRPKSIDGFRDGRRCGVQLCMNMLFPLGRTWLVKQCRRRIQGKERLL